MLKPDIIHVIESEGIHLVHKGKVFTGLCPFHDDKSPSFTVWPLTQKFYCFGCHSQGDVIDFISELKGIQFQEARQYLGITSRIDFKVVQQSKQRAAEREYLKRKETEYTSLVASLLRRIDALISNVRDMDEAVELAELYHIQPILEYKYAVLTGQE